MFVKITNGAVAQYPYTVGELRRDNHPTGFPRDIPVEMMAEYGMFPVGYTGAPTIDPLLEKVAISDQPSLVEGEWKLTKTVVPITEAELSALRSSQEKNVARERDRRLGLDFEFQGQMYQRDAKSVARISGAGTLALGAIVAGAQVGDLRWHGGDTDFSWIASDNATTTMDAQTCFAFGAAAAAVETELVFKAKALREMDPIPDDYHSDTWWV